MNIQSFEGGYDKNLCYVISCPTTKIAAVIDPSVSITPVTEYIEANDLILSKILISHTHHDHIFYLDNFLYLFPNIEVICHENHIKKFEHHTVKVTDYEIITLGLEILISIHTPGHYADSICYWNEKRDLLFTGDTIFVGRTGRVQSNNSNIHDLYNSVYNKIFKLSHDTVIYPGHNYGFSESISIKDNINFSKFFSCKSFEEFELVMKNFEKNYKP